MDVNKSPFKKINVKGEYKYKYINDVKGEREKEKINRRNNKKLKKNSGNNITRITKNYSTLKFISIQKKQPLRSTNLKIHK